MKRNQELNWKIQALIPGFVNKKCMLQEETWNRNQYIEESWNKESEAGTLFLIYSWVAPTAFLVFPPMLGGPEVIGAT